MQGDGIAKAADATRECCLRRLAEQHLEAATGWPARSCGIRPRPRTPRTMPSSRPGASGRPCAIPTRFEPWFDRILVNTCRNQLRRTSHVRTQALLDNAATVRADPIGQALTGGRARLAQLSPDHRVVVALRFYRDLTVDEIARVGTAQGTVNSQLHYAMKRLQGVVDRADAARTTR